MKVKLNGYGDSVNQSINRVKQKSQFNSHPTSSQRLEGFPLLNKKLITWCNIRQFLWFIHRNDLLLRKNIVLPTSEVHTNSTFKHHWDKSVLSCSLYSNKLLNITNQRRISSCRRASPELPTTCVNIKCQQIWTRSILLQIWSIINLSCCLSKRLS